MSDGLQLVSSQGTPDFNALVRDDTNGNDAVYDFTSALTVFADEVTRIFTQDEDTWAALPDDAPEFATHGKTASTIDAWVSNMIAAGKMKELRAVIDQAELIINPQEDEDESDDEDESEDDSDEDGDADD